MRSANRICATICWCATMATPLLAQPAQPSSRSAASSCQPTLAQMRQVVTSTWTDTHDANAVLRKLDALIDYHPMEKSGLAERDGAGVSVQFPSRIYRFMVMEAMRKREPLDTISVPSVVTVFVETERITGPDIEKVIVERDGKPVTPLSTSIKPVVKTTALGAKALLHEGTVTFACEAFAPGASVAVLGIPAGGSNIEVHYTSAELSSRTLGRPLATPTP